MPIFQDPEHQRLQDVWSDDHQPRLNARRQTISPWKHPPGEPLGSHPLTGPQNVPYEGPSPDQSRAGMHATNREELIQYIKSSDAPRWASHHSVCPATVEPTYCLGFFFSFVLSYPEQQKLYCHVSETLLTHSFVIVGKQSEPYLSDIRCIFRQYERQSTCKCWS